MKVVEIKNNEINYSVYIGSDVLNQIHKYLDVKKKVLIITDDLVSNLYIVLLKDCLRDYQIDVFNMGNAENNKNLVTYDACIKYALDNYLDRDLQVIAFGGGAVGDFAGFFASTYKRGVKFINIPTTLLAHDSAVGGKVAVNAHGIKNVIGTFYQPKAVIYDTSFLKTLDLKEIKSGFGEVFKHDLLSDGRILNELLNKQTDLTEIVQNESLIEEILYKCIEIKKHYILDDIEDKLGVRQALNLGHTIAHAIEILNDYSHGEAVALGMCFDLFLSQLNFEFYYKQFRKLGYFNQEINFNLYEILLLLRNDKKNKPNKVVFVGLISLGKPYEIILNEEEFLKKFEEFLNLIKNW